MVARNPQQRICTKTRQILALALLVSGTAAGQSVYKCTGPDGETVFSQRPCGESSETVDVGPTNSSAPPSSAAGRVYDEREREREAEARERQAARSSRTGGPGSYACQGAKDSVKSAQERWDRIKRRGYTPNEQIYFEQLIRERKRHADNVCR